MKRGFQVQGLFAPDDPASKQSVVTAALELFVEKGYDGTTVREIGERAGYSNPVIFKYFRDKEELAHNVFLACYRSVAAVLAPAIRDDRPYRENVRALCEAFRDVAETQLAAFLFVSENLRRFWPKTSASLRRLALIPVARRLIEQGQREGVVAAGADVSMLVAAMVGLMSQIARMRYFGSFRDVNNDWPRSMERVLLSMGR